MQDTEQATISSLAGEAASYFEMAKREPSGEDFARTKDGTPEWVADLVQRAPHVEGEEELGDDRLQNLWDGLAETYWPSLTEQARERGLAQEVYSGGRSGGWAVPSPTIDPDEQPERFEEFRELAQGERDYYRDELWPERVQEALAELEAQRERNIVRGTS